MKVFAFLAFHLSTIRIMLCDVVDGDAPEIAVNFINFDFNYDRINFSSVLKQ